MDNATREYRKKVRQAVANYLETEGYGWYRGKDHDKHETALAKILNVPMYSDKSGYDFSRFSTKNVRARLKKVKY